eukprot:Nitzschia sp. Nitz4//scaffold26_size159584//122393//123124//NITZ4_002510-RA/size159584-processed-gene-0.205-mRNA-1//1//CDS//3329545139//4361//frame0
MSYQPLTQALHLNNEASQEVMARRYAPASKLLAQALITLREFVSQFQDSEPSASRSMGVKVSLATQDFRDEVLPNHSTFIFREPFLLRAYEKQERTADFFEEIFCTASLAIIVNMAICHQAQAMNLPCNNNEDMKKAVQLYLHASRLLNKTSHQEEHQEANEVTSANPCELVILNNLVLAFEYMGETEQANACYSALSNAAMRFKSTAELYSCTSESDQALVDLFLSLIFSNIVGTPNVAPAA